MKTYAELESICTNVRKNILKMVNSASSGHPGGSLSAVELLTSLYFNEMNINEDNVNLVDRDKFVLSKGHASPLLYSVLAEKGFIKESDLSTFRKTGSKLQGHPNMNYISGVDMSTGSLGQGISCAVGMALSNKIHNKPYTVYALLGDGELEEGQVWEAAMCAAHYKLNNLIAMVDFNGLQIDGAIDKVMNPCPIDSKFEAFGWNVIVINGHNLAEIENAFKIAKESLTKPTVIIAKTTKGKGISFMENNPNWHGAAPSNEELELALKELGGIE